MDLCGGYGRIGIPLTKKGYHVYIQDLNEDFLRQAEENAKKENLEIQTIHSDMREIPFKEEFDATINIFTSFGYLETKQEDLKVLETIYKALKPKGKFLIDIVNKTCLLSNFQTKTWRKIDNIFILEENHWDKKTSQNSSEVFILDFDNCKYDSTLMNLRLYNFEELENMINKSGMKIIQKYGNFEKEKFSKEGSKRIIILAEK